MHNIVFYRDRDGRQPVLEYLLALSKKADKDSRIRLNKIGDYMNC